MALNPQIIMYLLILSVVIIFALSVLLIKAWWKKTSDQMRISESFENGLQKEREAAKLLIKWGYTIIAEQKKYFHNFSFGGEHISIPVVIDYLVEKDNKQFVIEVKSGSKAIDIKDKHTRRQILEYFHAVKADGFYLLNMERKEMKKVIFSKT